MTLIFINAYDGATSRITHGRRWKVQLLELAFMAKSVVAIGETPLRDSGCVIEFILKSESVKVLSSGFYAGFDATSKM